MSTQIEKYLNTKVEKNTQPPQIFKGLSSVSSPSKALSLSIRSAGLTSSLSGINGQCSASEF